MVWISVPTPAIDAQVPLANMFGYVNTSVRCLRTRSVYDGL